MNSRSDCLMRAVIQRVSRASVEVDGTTVGRIGLGWLVLLGVARGDGEPGRVLAGRQAPDLRVFEDEQGKMNRSVVDVAGRHPGRQPVHAPGRLPDRPPAQLHRGRRARRGRAALPAVRRAPGRVGAGGRHRRLSGDDEGRAGQRRSGDPPARQPEAVLNSGQWASARVMRHAASYRSVFAGS